MASIPQSSPSCSSSSTVEALRCGAGFGGCAGAAEALSIKSEGTSRIGVPSVLGSPHDTQVTMPGSFVVVHRPHVHRAALHFVLVSRKAEATLFLRCAE